MKIKTTNKKVEKILSQPRTVDKVSDYSMLCLFLCNMRAEGTDVTEESFFYIKGLQEEVEQDREND